ncbi:transmembrane and coiled-coil domain-containing protein 6 isoform X2 [Halyomorpha halys]|uniref:transmembrane and coiled-coil domain-containing protein 6 isoform X2 n=1 Tax=Halyomorpha halys TaxID=286706 RepID=UPI0006D52104|nr:uncharacterized protein LOC106685166 isoform X2 [Halyomorpha halys]
MGDEAPDNVLQRVRENNHVERINKRKAMYDKQRNIDGKPTGTKIDKLTEEEFINAARTICSGPSDLKEKSLSILKTGFIVDKAWMISFMKVEGALHALVKCLMSHNPVEQLLAAECCCNLSLGDTRTCFKLAKAATPYLISILQGLNHNLMNVCLLTVFNLCGSGEKSCELLHSQGILNVLEKTMSIIEVRENSMKALTTLTKNGSSYITEAEVIKLVHSILPHFESVRVQWLVYLLSSLPYVIPILLQEDLPRRILLILDLVSYVSHLNITSVTALVRLLGNMSADQEGITACTMIAKWAITCRIFKFFSTTSYRHLGYYFSVDQL